MSQLGNIDSTYGKQIILASADISAEALINSSNLPKNSIIIASPTNESGDDLGTYCLVTTDSNGDAVRLTYTIQPGNGLVIDGDIVKLSIDRNTIVEDNESIYINADSFVDSATIISQNNILSVNTSNLIKTSSDNFGISRPDGVTILSNDGVITVNTQSLDKSSNITGEFGLVSGNYNEVVVDNGYIKIETSNLPKATSSNYGICKPDNKTIISYNGVLSINYDSLTYSTYSNYGIARPDNKTLILNNGVVKVNTSGLSPATSTTYGVVRIDNTSLVNVNGSISVKNIDVINNDISYISTAIDSMKVKINAIKSSIDELSSI